MDQRERLKPLDGETFRIAMEGNQANLWTGLPGIIQSYNAVKNTCTVQPAIKAQVRGPSTENSWSWVNLPLLVDVLVIFPQAGGFAMTFPLQAGDEVFVMFACRCIDAWWQSGGVQVQAELRMHSLSDGFAYPGPWSVPRVIPNISTSSAQLRTADGTCYVELASGGKVNIVAPGGVHVTGTITASDEITAKTTHTVSNHTHSDPQGGVTGLPTG